MNTSAIHFLSVDEVISIQAETAAIEGGDSGLRDAGLLESAVAMPMASYGGHYLHPDVPAMAAAYLFHICQANAFVDGNKRTAVLAMIVFIRANHWEINASRKELLDITLQVAQSTISKDDLIQWVRSMTKPTAKK